MYGQLARATDEFAAAAAPYVCVRVMNMAEVDLNLVRFDFDLTIAVVLMHGDGTVYHRYGSRDAHDAMSWMSIPSLVRLLHDTLQDHQQYCKSPHPPAAQPPLRPIDLPPLQKRIATGNRIDCVHCHTVNDMEHAFAVEQHRWHDDDLWVYPDPSRLGLSLDAEQQNRVREVAADSPAARAGLRPGDLLLQLGAQDCVRTIADIEWALHRADFGATKLALRFQRGDAPHDAQIELAAGWKRCPPEDYAWRSYKWNLSPSSGFGGPALTASEKTKLGIADGKSAFRVQYIVDWGDKAHRGAAVKKAGIRKDDVVLSFAGKDDFQSVDHFHAWVSLTRHAGEDVEVVLLRGGERRTVHYALPE